MDNFYIIQGKKHLPILAIPILCAMWIAFSLRDGGVGVTWDEPRYAVSGSLYCGLIDAKGFGSVDPWSINHEHPPLAKMIMGAGSFFAAVVTAAPDPADPIGRSVAAPDSLLLGSRAAVMAMFGLLLIGVWKLVEPLGWKISLLAVLFCVASPRLVGHAQLATLDLPLVCFWIWTLLAVERAILPISKNSSNVITKESKAGVITYKDIPVNVMWLFAAAIFCGCAFLTKFTGIILPVVTAVFVIGLLLYEKRFGKRGEILNLNLSLIIVPLMIVMAAVMFFIGWPWLYENTWERFVDYWHFSTKHNMCPLLYLGKVYGAAWKGSPPPFHYASVMLLITTPFFILLPAFGGMALFVKKVFAKQNPVSGEVREWRIMFLVLLGGLALPMATMLPGSVAYDGVRLFLPATVSICIFAAWAVVKLLVYFVRQKIAGHLEINGKAFSSLIIIFLTLVFLLGGYAIDGAFAQDRLGYYNIIVGGAEGSGRIGMEPCYMATALRPKLLRQLSNTGIFLFQSKAGKSLKFKLEEPERIRFIGFGSVAPGFTQAVGYLSDKHQIVDDDSWTVAIVLNRRSLDSVDNILKRAKSGEFNDIMVLKVCNDKFFGSVDHVYFITR